MVTLPPLERGLTILEAAASAADGLSWTEARALVGDVSTATISKLLKVLCRLGYLVAEDGRYKIGPRIDVLSNPSGPEERLRREADRMARIVSRELGESAVVAAYDENGVEFVGVDIVEGSLGYAHPGNRLAWHAGHVTTQPLHAGMEPERIEKLFAAGSIDFGLNGRTPEWKDYATAIAEGMETGLFLEFGWRRSQFFRFARPLFANDGRVIGCLMGGFFDERELTSKRDRIVKTTARAAARFGETAAVFKKGMERLRRQRGRWLAQTTRSLT